MVAGGAIMAGAGYLSWREYQKGELLRDYLAEVQELEAFYKTAAADGSFSEEDRRGTETRERALDTKEREIQRKDMVAELVDSLARLGIVVSAGYITAKVLRIIQDRHKPPPPYKSVLDGEQFSTTEGLEQHVKEVHGVDQEALDNAQMGFQNLAPTWQRWLAAASGLGERIYQRWAEQPAWVYLAIAAACVLLIVLTYYLLAPALAPVLVAVVI